MEFLKPIIDYIIKLKDKEFQQYMIAILAGITLICCGTIYVTYSRSKGHIITIKQLKKLEQKSYMILSDNQKIQLEEDRIQKLIEQNKEFSIKTYFEKFTREHNAAPEANWDTTVNPIEGNDKFDEVVLPATFKKQTTKTLVTLLDALDKNEIVYLKEVAITHEEGQKISFTLTIATKKPKRQIEE